MKISMLLAAILLLQSASHAQDPFDIDVIDPLEPIIHSQFDIFPIQDLIDRLGSPSYAHRRWANNELAKLGAEGQARLEKATHSDDLEIQLRAERLLRDLKVRLMWSASHVEYSASNESASDALKSITKSSGNLLAVGDRFRTFVNKKIDIN
jgi:hypothetical protein